jgi:ferredoxin
MEERARMQASRSGEGSKIIANHSLTAQERRKCMEEMLMALDNTPSDPKTLEYDYTRTSGKSPALIAAELKEKGLVAPPEEKPGLLGKLRGTPKPVEALKESTKEATEEDLRKAFANDNMQIAEWVAAEASGVPEEAVVSNVDGLVPPEIDDPAAAEEKGPPTMIPGHELLGDIPVVFQPNNVMTMARVGQPLSEVAAGADQFIRYKCRKGECKTCVVKINNKWVSACQTKIPPMASGESFNVGLRNVDPNKVKKESATFFSPKSIWDGFFNNALGMVGFARDGLAGEEDFQDRMERERLIDEITAKKKKEKELVSQGAKLSDLESEDGHAGLLPGLVALSSFMLALLGLKKIRSFQKGLQEPLIHY